VNDECCDADCEVCQRVAHIEGIYEGVAVENARGIDGLS
jgi:hypothetical protein